MLFDVLTARFRRAAGLMSPRRAHALSGTVPLGATLLCVAAVVAPIAARAQGAELAASARPSYEVSGEVTVTGQQLFPFHSPYAGTNSLPSRHEGEISDTYTLFLGTRLSRQFEVYIDPEMARGQGVGQALGLAGYTNGDVIRNPTLGQDPYLARYFVRWTVLTGRGMETIEPDVNQIGGRDRPTHRLIVTAGKLGTNDLFDTNAYANSTRTQFENWALINDVAYDYAADTRGYTQGVALEWIQPDWALRAGSFQMPTEANGSTLATDLTHSRGDQIEAALRPRLVSRTGIEPAAVRLLAYRNLADMGDYRQALTLAARTGSTPDITAARHRGAVKYGFGLSAEQPLGDGGDTGLFARAGWNDGRTESFAYTEAERSVSGGAQISGARWRRPTDRFAVALAASGLSSAHRDYLAAGGLGFLLGDGHLHYGPERLVEAYYAWQAVRPFTVTLDFQGIANPGYNRDRGPVSVLSLRLHEAF